MSKQLRLLKQSLEEKWTLDMDIKTLMFKCPFCYDTLDDDDKLHCNACLCPSDICDHRGYAGFINQMRPLGDPEDENIYNGCWNADLLYMRSLFQKHIRELEDGMDA